MKTTLKAAATALAVLAVAGCAQQREPGYYETGRESTTGDATYRAQGNNERAPSQIQLGFGRDAKAPPAAPPTEGELAAEAARAATARPLIEPKTFLGTVPCLRTDAQCVASRYTVTLAPGGEWRARAVAMDANQKVIRTLTQQGCWQVTGTQPWRIALRSGDNAVASLTFINDNVLRVNSIQDTQPKLEYRLTRQADIDGINELKNPAALQCGS